MAETNAGRKAKRLRAYINRQHDWRVEVWAQAQLRIDGAQQELIEMGEPPADLHKPDFDDPAMVRHYAGVDSE